MRHARTHDPRQSATGPMRLLLVAIVVLQIPPGPVAAMARQEPLLRGVPAPLAGANTPAAVPAAMSDQPDALAPAAAPEEGPLDPAVAQLAADARQLLDGKVPAGAIQTALLLAVLSLAPAILLMTTSYVRVSVVLGLLRQALGAPQLPPNQVLAALSVFVTILVMAPVWQEIRREAIDPCLQSETAPDWDLMCQKGLAPLKRFMVNQIVAAGNLDAINVFQRHAAGPSQSPPPPVTRETVHELPVHVVLPAFLVSELKTAFLIGFRIFLPFLVLDLVVSTLAVSMGMVMLPPAMISLPLKLILFVLADGWNLVMGMLLQGFVPGMGS